MRLGATTVSGPNMFGLDNDNIRALIESQEESLKCVTYVHSFLRVKKVSKKRGPQKNPASSKPHGRKKSKTTTSTNVGTSKKRKAPDIIDISEGDFKTDENGGLLELPQGWSKQVKMREGGATAGQRDTYFIDPNGKRYRSVVEVERALGLRPPKGSQAAAVYAGNRSKPKRSKTDSSGSNLKETLNEIKKQLKINGDEIDSEEIFNIIFELNDHYKKAKKYEKNGDTREKISKYEDRYEDKVKEILKKELVNVTNKALDESLIYDQLEKYSKKGTKAIKKLTKNLITGLKKNANKYEMKLKQAHDMLKEQTQKAGGSDNDTTASSTATNMIAQRRSPLIAPSPDERNEKKYLMKRSALKKTRIRLNEVCGWKITYTYGNHCLWLITPSAMYIIQSDLISSHGEASLHPSSHYVPLFSSMKRKMDACTSMVHLIQTWAANGLGSNKIKLKMLVNAMVNGGDKNGPLQSKSTKEGEEEEEEGEEDSDGENHQKEILQKLTDYMLRHPIFLTEQLKRHDKQDLRRWLRYGGIRKVYDEHLRQENLALAEAQASSSSPVSPSSTNTMKVDANGIMRCNTIFVPRYLPVSEVQCATQLENAGARRVAKLMNKRKAKEAQRQRALDRKKMLAEKKKQKLIDQENLRLQSLRYVDMSLLEEVRSQQKNPKEDCDTLVQKLCLTMKPFPIPIPSLININHELLETMLQVSYVFESWPNKGRKGWNDLFSLIKECTNNNNHDTNINRFHSIYTRMLSMVINEGESAWNTKHDPMARLHFGGTAMTIFNENIHESGTTLNDISELNIAMSTCGNVVWPEILRRCLRNSWSEGCTLGSSSSIKHLLDPVRSDGLTLCLGVLNTLLDDPSSELFSMVVDSSTLAGEGVGTRYAQLVPEPMNLQTIKKSLLDMDGLYKQLTYNGNNGSSITNNSSSSFFELPPGCLEFARHVRLVFNNCITFWSTMIQEEEVLQQAEKEKEEDASAESNAELKAQGDEMYVGDNKTNNVAAAAVALSKNPLSLYNWYNEEDLKNIVKNAKRLLKVFEAEYNHHVVDVLQTHHELSSVNISSPSRVSNKKSIDTSFQPYQIPSSVDTNIIGTTMEEWSLRYNLVRKDSLNNESLKSALLLRLWTSDPDLVPLHDDYICMILQFNINELLGSDYFRNDLKKRKEIEKDLYKEKLELMRNLKNYEVHLKQHELDIKAQKEKQIQLQAEEDAKIAAKLASGQRISTRDRTAVESFINSNNNQQSEASQIVSNYEGPTSKSKVEEFLSLKKEKIRERIHPLGTDRHGNKYWCSPSMGVHDNTTPMILLVEHCRNGRFHSYKEEKDIQQLMSCLLAQVSYMSHLVVECFFFFWIMFIHIYSLSFIFFCSLSLY